MYTAVFCQVAAMEVFREPCKRFCL
uniref:Uncharacterized protein n=1 Tax=Anguilla anguilla TaxID=7936 RepID=A0A0E9S3A1_ANGAN